MKKSTTMPIGIDDFKKVCEEYYYVDKTSFIKTLIDGHSQVTLITRPRRFGKTLSLSMLKYFFSLEGAEENRKLFEESDIAQAGKQYMSLQGTKPVIFLTLKDIKQADFSSMMENFGILMGSVYNAFRFLLDGAVLYPEEKEYFQSILYRKASHVDLQFSLKKLTSYLRRYYNKPVLVLLDEYDAPIQAAWDYNYYDDAIVFMRNYLSLVLKSNVDLDFAVVTGVLRIAKESIFSSLNNLKVSSVVGGGLPDVVGFTNEEIKQIAMDFSCPEKFAEIKAWYDGYNFSGHEIYNPWSVINYFDNNCQPATYWGNTSSNNILHTLLKNATNAQARDLTELLHGKKIKARLDEGVIYEDIHKNRNALNSMLLTTGYLTMVDYPNPYDGDLRGTMRIPNQEIQFLFKREVMNYLETISTEDSELLENLLDNLLTGNITEFAAGLKKYLKLMVSYYDTANRESFYHGLLLGLLATLIPRYEVLSNRESGYGRFDVAVFPNKGQDIGVLMEFKVAETEAQLSEKAEEALAQIEANEYLTEFENRNVSTVWQYGISFCGKKCSIAAKK
jgi:hypothetical protein